MFYNFQKNITVANFGKNDLGIHITYTLEGIEKNLAYPAEESDDILLEAVGEGFKDIQFSQMDAINVAAYHEETMHTKKYLNRIEMASCANALNN